MIMAHIIADTREENGANPYLESCIAKDNRINSKLSINVGGGDITFEKKQRAVGDYRICIGGEVVAIFERKTWKDLSASIKDGRAREQHERLEEFRDQHDCQAYYIIEGVMIMPDTRLVANIPFKNIAAKTRHNLIRGIPHVQSKDAEGTAQLIVNFARDYMKLLAKKEITLPVFADDKNEEYIRELLKVQNKYRERVGKISAFELIDGILKNMEKEVRDAKIEECRKNKKKSAGDDGGKGDGDDGGKGDGDDGEKEATVPIRERTVTAKSRLPRSNIDIVIRMWAAIPGVSLKSAAILADKYSLSAIIRAGEDRRQTLRVDLANLTFEGGNIFGTKKADKILTIAYEGGNLFKLGELREVSAKVLACIPGITLDVSKQIVTKYPLRSICGGDISVDDLAAVEKTGGKSSEKGGGKTGGKGGEKGSEKSSEKGSEKSSEKGSEKSSEKGSEKGRKLGNKLAEKIIEIFQSMRRRPSADLPQ